MASAEIHGNETCRKCGFQGPFTPEFFRRRGNGTLEYKCHDCHRAYCKAYFERNKERMLAGFRAARAANPEFHRERDRRYFQDNRDAKREAAKRKWAKADKAAARENIRAWKAANPEKAREIETRRLERIKASPELKAKNAERTKRLRAKDPEKHRTRRRDLYHQHAEGNREYQRKYRQANNDRIRAQEKAYREAKPEVQAAADERRRARMHGAEGTCTAKDIVDLLKKYGRRCYYCSKPFKRFEVDHFIPLSLGGSNWPSNLVLACAFCNRSKGPKLPWEWRPGMFSPGDLPHK